jgi:hypothetical protein
MSLKWNHIFLVASCPKYLTDETELFVKIKGDMKYLYALMDDETRFWIAQQIADTKYTANINPLFKEGKQLIGKRPNTLISDGAPLENERYSYSNGLSDIP